VAAAPALAAAAAMSVTTRQLLATEPTWPRRDLLPLQQQPAGPRLTISTRDTMQWQCTRGSSRKEATTVTTATAAAAVAAAGVLPACAAGSWAAVSETATTTTEEQQQHASDSSTLQRRSTAGPSHGKHLPTALLSNGCSGRRQSSRSFSSAASLMQQQQQQYSGGGVVQMRHHSCRRVFVAARLQSAAVSRSSTLRAATRRQAPGDALAQQLAAAETARDVRHHLQMQLYVLSQVHISGQIARLVECCHVIASCGSWMGRLLRLSSSSSCQVFA